MKSNFKDHYYNEVNLPIHFDCCYINENDEVEFRIPMQYIPYLVDSGALILSYKDKKFKTYSEAIEYYDKNILNEVKRGQMIYEPSVEFEDPETGEKRQFEVSPGNIKVGGDTVLLNMSTATNCMSAIIGLCKLGPNGVCYALRAEKRFPRVLGKDVRQEKEWACLRPAAIAEGLNKIAKKLGNISFVRINEAGEFRNLPADPAMLAKVSDEMKAKLGDVDDVKKLQEVAKELKKLKSPLILYTYTHRTDLNAANLADNIVVNGSGFMLDNAFIPLEFSEFANVMNMIKSGKIKGKKYGGANVNVARWCLGDCRVCKWCKVKENKHIFIPIHGAGTEHHQALDALLEALSNKPQFADIASDISMDKKQKGEAIYKILTPEEKKKLDILIPLQPDRVDLLGDFVSGKYSIEQFVQILNSYYAPDTSKDARKAIAKSLEALAGQFKKEIERAEAEGQTTAATVKWPGLIRGLEKAKQAAKEGKTPKPSKSLSRRFLALHGKK